MNKLMLNNKKKIIKHGSYIKNNKINCIITTVFDISELGNKSKKIFNKKT